MSTGKSKLPSRKGIEYLQPRSRSQFSYFNIHLDWRTNGFGSWRVGYHWQWSFRKFSGPLRLENVRVLSGIRKVEFLTAWTVLSRLCHEHDTQSYLSGGISHVPGQLKGCTRKHGNTDFSWESFIKWLLLLFCAAPTTCWKSKSTLSTTPPSIQTLISQEWVSTTSLKEVVSAMSHPVSFYDPTTWFL